MAKKKATTAPANEEDFETGNEAEGSEQENENNEAGEDTEDVDNTEPVVVRVLGDDVTINGYSVRKGAFIGGLTAKQVKDQQASGVDLEVILYDVGAENILDVSKPYETIR